MSRMGRTSATALFVLAIATLALVPHVSASITVRDLGTLPGYTLSEGFGINAAGRILGTRGDGEAQSRPFLWGDDPPRRVDAKSLAQGVGGEQIGRAHLRTAGTL